MTAVTACPEYTAARSSEQQKSSCPNRQEPFTAASHVHGTHLGPQISAPYSASVTASSHSLEQASPGTSMARCENQLSAAAPCQCFTSGGMLTTSPGCSFRAGFPHSWYQPRPATQTRICPPPLAASGRYRQKSDFSSYASARVPSSTSPSVPVMVTRRT